VFTVIFNGNGEVNSISECMDFPSESFVALIICKMESYCSFVGKPVNNRDTALDTNPTSSSLRKMLRRICGHKTEKITDGQIRII